MTDSASSTSTTDPEEILRTRCREVLAGPNGDMPEGVWVCPYPQCGERARRKHWVADHILQHVGAAAGYHPAKPVSGPLRFKLIELD